MAFAGRTEEESGTLKPGKHADFVVLSDDPFGVPPSMDRYPARSLRTHRLSEVREGVRGWVAGRVLKVEEGGFLLRDGSGKLWVEGKGPRPGDLVEVEGEHKGGVWQASRWRLLAPFRGDWGKLREDPRPWVRMLVGGEGEVVHLRAEVSEAIRRFFRERGFVEVDPPALVRLPGMEPHIEPFRTVRHAGGKELPCFLHTSPEYAMKKLLAAGFESVFFLGYAYRDEEPSKTHSPAFLMLEWYRAYSDYAQLIEDCEALFCELFGRFRGGLRFRYLGRELDVSPPWPRLSVRDAMLEFAGVDVLRAEVEELRKASEAKGHRVDGSWGWDDLFFLLFLEEVEPKIGKPKPTFVMDYPARLSSLARMREGEPNLVERFELYFGGLELANAFSELTDPDEQRERLLRERAERERLGRMLYPVDEEFLEVLSYGMPPSAGIALGVERLLMLIMDKEDIAEVQPFPAFLWHEDG